MEDVLLRREKIQEVVKSYLGLMSTARPCVQRMQGGPQRLYGSKLQSCRHAIHCHVDYELQRITEVVSFKCNFSRVEQLSNTASDGPYHEFMRNKPLLETKHDIWRQSMGLQISVVAILQLHTTQNLYVAVMQSSAQGLELLIPMIAKKKNEVQLLLH